MLPMIEQASCSPVLEIRSWCSGIWTSLNALWRLPWLTWAFSPSSARLLWYYPMRADRNCQCFLLSLSPASLFFNLSVVMGGPGGGQACLGSSPAAVALRPYIAEAGLVHLIFEMLVSARVTEGGFMPTLWLHHIASVVGFSTCLLTGNPTALLFSTRLAVVGGAMAGGAARLMRAEAR